MEFQSHGSVDYLFRRFSGSWLVLLLLVSLLTIFGLQISMGGSGTAWCNGLVGHECCEFWQCASSERLEPLNLIVGICNERSTDILRLNVRFAMGVCRRDHPVNTRAIHRVWGTALLCHLLGEGLGVDDTKRAQRVGV